MLWHSNQSILFLQLIFLFYNSQNFWNSHLGWKRNRFTRSRHLDSVLWDSRFKTWPGHFFFPQGSLLSQPLPIRRLKCQLALCYRNQDKLWPDRALDLSVYLTFLPSLWAISKTASNIGWNVKYLLLPPPFHTHTNKQINIPSPCQLIYNDCPPPLLPEISVLFAIFVGKWSCLVT